MPDEKTTFEQKMEAQKRVVQSDLEMLREKIANANSAKRQEFSDQLEEIDGIRKRFDEKLENLKNAGDDAWRDMKADIQSVWSEFDKAVRAVKRDVI